MAGLFDQFNPLSRLPTNQYGLADSSAITKGTLVSFHYPRSFAMIPNVIHDHYPMVIITDIWNNYIRGVNLHYLTFPYVKALLTKFGGNTQFNYFHIKPDQYMASAFRMYVRAGVKRPKKLDVKWLISVLQGVRSFAPGEIEKIRANIQKQIQMRLQAKAKELTSYDEWRKQLTESQKRQFRGKVQQANQAVTRGAQESLIKPAPEGQQPKFSDDVDFINGLYQQYGISPDINPDLGTEDNTQ
jgi:hypothetical protein